MSPGNKINRRRFVTATLLTAAGATIAPGLLTGCRESRKPMKRIFGKTGFEVTTLGLGGQASLQWTPDGVDPVKIILKAFNLGINYFDTSNLYGPSQENFGKAFSIKSLIPGLPQYNEELRKSIFLTTKTHLRFAKGGDGEIKGVTNWTNGKPGTHTIDDLRRSLSIMFGDGNGNYPSGSYIDLMLIHNLNTREEVDALYEGIENTDPNADRIGALAALRDYRDGTNLTGLNPQKERLIKHIGFSGHFDPSVMMYMIQRDRTDLLDAMLVAINANDKLMFNMQYNVIPLAAAKNMGVIAMKVFADGAMYSKNAEWSENPSHVVMSMSDPSLPSHSLVRYSLTTPGVHLAIIGTGHISDSFFDCQLSNNLAAAQVLPDGMSDSEREEIEKLAAKVKQGKTNYFQTESKPLTAPDGVRIVPEPSPDGKNVTIGWNTAFAGDSPLERYEIFRDGSKIGEVPFKPQLTTDPITFIDRIKDNEHHIYSVRILDKKGRTADSAKVECL